jgi:FHS family L-fucose permease-like MFS transporter
MRWQVISGSLPPGLYLNSDGSIIASLDLLKQKRFGFGAACIFLYVGAEVAIGSFIVNYLMQSSVLGVDEQSAGKLIPLYWGGALVGRFLGSGLLRVLSPGKVLMANATGAIALIIISTNSSGAVAGYALLLVGLMNSIMFPTIFSLACEGLGPRTADGSGVICVAIVGGAVIPPLTGTLADLSGSLAIAFTLPALCYAVIAAFGLYATKPLRGEAPN